MRPSAEYINAPCWKSDGEELAALRASVKDLKTVDDIHFWIEKCLDISLDPL